MSSYERRRKENLGRNLSIGLAHEDWVRKQRLASKTLSEDSLIRQEIHTYIRDICTSTKRTKSEILETLANRFSDSKYDKYRTYFETWVSDVLAKMGRKTEEHLEDEER